MVQLEGNIASAHELLSSNKSANVCQGNLLLYHNNLENS